MTTRSILMRLARVVADEADRNEAFEAAIAEALSNGVRKSKQDVSPDADLRNGENARSKNRRKVAIVDPVHLARDGEQALRKVLQGLTLEQLKDIVAEFGMDTGKLVMKWTMTDRVIDRIVEISVARAHKGAAFRKSPDTTVEAPKNPHSADTAPDSATKPGPDSSS